MTGDFWNFIGVLIVLSAIPLIILEIQKRF